MTLLIVVSVMVAVFVAIWGISEAAFYLWDLDKDKRETPISRL